jgi:hypothetical protein
MTSRILLTGVIASAALRRKRRDTGAVFGVAKIRDSDPRAGAARIWTTYINDLDLIEQFEALRVGEPVAVTGAFSVVIAGSDREPKIEHRISAEALIDTKRKRKQKGLISKESRVESDELDLAPKEPEFNDAIPF